MMNEHFWLGFEKQAGVLQLGEPLLKAPAFASKINSLTKKPTNLVTNGVKQLPKQLPSSRVQTLTAAQYADKINSRVKGGGSLVNPATKSMSPANAANEFVGKQMNSKKDFVKQVKPVQTIAQ